MTPEWREITKAVFETGAWRNLRYCGVRIGQFPLDLWRIQETIEELKPALIIEYGTQAGGSALSYAHAMDRNNFGRIVTIEKTDRHTPPVHPRITYLKGRTLDEAIKVRIEAEAKESAKLGHVMLIEDSSHRHRHVLAELREYWRLVTVGSYFLVEDGALDHVMGWLRGYGPYRAVHDFLKECPNFQVDESKEAFGVTFWPSGWLKRIK